MIKFARKRGNVATFALGAVVLVLIVPLCQAVLAALAYGQLANLSAFKLLSIAIKDLSMRDTVVYSALVAAVSSLIAVTIAVPFAYDVAYYGNRLQMRRLLLLLLPLLVPDALQSYAVHSASAVAGIGRTTSVLVVAETVFLLPFVGLPVVNLFGGAGKSLQSASFDLGLTKGTFFWRVLIPFMALPVLLFWLLGIALVFNEFTRASWLAPRSTFAMKLNENLTAGGDPSTMILGVAFAIVPAGLLVAAVLMNAFDTRQLTQGSS